MIVPVPLSDIKEIIKRTPVASLIQSSEEGFILYSKKKVIVPTVGHLALKQRNADVHIKYGFIVDDDYYVIKIASGFYNNPSLGIQSSNGVMLVFNQKTGETLSILMDEGYLTDIRTAVAGAVAAKYLAPTKISCIGIVGTGVQAKLQLEFLKSVRDCRDVMVWGRSETKLTAFKNDPVLKDFKITKANSISELTKRCNLIVTTTPSPNPILLAKDIQPGTHITAMGADADGKQELDDQILAKADIIVADSKDQCIDHGDIGFAVRNKIINPSTIVELGDVIANVKLQRSNEKQITVVDLTGVAIQDIQIAKYVYLEHLKS